MAFERVVTGDGSLTYGHDIGETFHSRSGAREEAVKKFVVPCRIAEKSKIHVDVLDICFGLGYNSAAAIDAALGAGGSISIVAIEKDRDVLDLALSNLIPFDSSEIIKRAIRDGSYADGDVSFRLIVGDLRDELEKIEERFDAVFFDPFSPKKAPELWTEEVFRKIKTLMKPDAILATYSCARSVRDNMKKAGLKIEDGPRVGRRAPSTIGRIISSS